MKNFLLIGMMILSGCNSDTSPNESGGNNSISTSTTSGNGFGGMNGSNSNGISSTISVGMGGANIGGNSQGLGGNDCNPIRSCQNQNSCGIINDDGCGNRLECGNCPEHHNCVNNECICIRRNTCELGSHECNTVSDYCGGTINCICDSAEGETECGQDRFDYDGYPIESAAHICGGGCQSFPANTSPINCLSMNLGSANSHYWHCSPGGYYRYVYYGPHNDHNHCATSDALSTYNASGSLIEQGFCCDFGR